MYQGLGETYINVFFTLSAWSFVAAAAVVLIMRLVKRFAVGWLIAAMIVLGVAFSFASNSVFHRRMFVRQHQDRNTLVPATGCVRYEPSFGHLFAAYKMTAAEFDAWVSQHPWGLAEYDRGLMEYDEQMLGFSDPSEAYATEMASNGGQLRVYFKDGMMYLSYNVM
ncbi:hypothetical protein [Roseiconus lacunae]|uniref:Uncharacterized protein n=1 Tax=Roseiconus lacunae TaxID=2605694 RepID=A0ABT7PTB4_9BACT|nr:hypothetical protein [Roseiconus lacunae]MDM4019381.1 hypothetical protein [Roseiconus lacunae]